MKWLSAGLTFVNVATVWGLLGGLASHGLNRMVALSSFVAGLLAALLAFWGLAQRRRKQRLRPPTQRRSQDRLNPDHAASSNDIDRSGYGS